MTQLVLNIEQPSILPSLKKVLSLIEGVSIARPVGRTRTTRAKAETAEVRYPALDRAIEDVKKGNVYYAKDLDDLFDKLDI